jgi:glycosyltransferase involved in cell wall biosynthesis
VSPSLDIVIPVLNEEGDLPTNVVKLHGFLDQHLVDYDWQIIIADNGSTDSTLDLARELSSEYRRVEYIYMDQRGRGRALRRAWTESKSDIVSYMDVDLSTDLNSFPPLVDAISKEGYDIAAGSRLIKGSNVIGRGFKREVASRSYSLIFSAMFLTRFRDAQCGFKALNRRTVDAIVPLIQNTRWFFDTELLILAEKNGYRIKELPVKWTEDNDSRVNIAGTAIEDIKGLMRLRFGGLRDASRKLKASARNR